MANSVIQTIKDAEIDARSLSEFIYNPADAMVSRRLAPSIHTLNYYLRFFDNATVSATEDVKEIERQLLSAQQHLSSAQQQALSTVSYIEQTVSNAIDNTVIDNSPLSDALVSVDGSLSQRTINKGLESIADLSTINNPKDGLRVYVKSYHAGFGKGGGYFTYNTSRASENDGGTVINGWVRDSRGDTALLVEDFGAKGDSVSYDSVAIQNALNKGGAVHFSKGSTYKVSQCLLVSNSTQEIVGNSAKIIFTREQIGGSSLLVNSLFYNYERTDPLTISDIELEYTGTKVHATAYSGYVNGIDIRSVTGFDGLFINRVTAYNFNRAGLQIAHSGAYITTVRVSNCHLYNNRVAGVWYGNVDDIILQGNLCEYNGIDEDFGTGYGIASISDYYPKNIKVIHNTCNNNYRKGIDTHSGFNILIDGNTCLRNKYYGIMSSNLNVVDGVVKDQGFISIINNVVADMRNDSDPQRVESTGIMVGKYGSPETVSNKATYITVANNTIKNLVATGSSTISPLIFLCSGFRDATVLVHGNYIEASKVGYAISVSESRGDGEAIHAGGTLDMTLTNNTMIYTDADSQYMRIVGASAIRRLIHRGNDITFKGAIPQQMYTTLINYSDAVWKTGDIKPENPLHVFESNNLTIEGLDSFLQDIVINYGLDWVVQRGNTFNGKPYREYSDKIYRAYADTLPTNMLWLKGSIITKNTAPSDGEVVSWVATKSGEGLAAEWKPIAKVGTGQGVVARALESELADKSHPINTTNKSFGKFTYSSTTGTMYYALSDTATGKWRSTTGPSQDITPS